MHAPLATAYLKGSTELEIDLQESKFSALEDMIKAAEGELKQLGWDEDKAYAEGQRQLEMYQQYHDQTTDRTALPENDAEYVLSETKHSPRLIELSTLVLGFCCLGTVE